MSSYLLDTTLVALDGLIDDTTNKIRVLGNLDHTSEKEMAMGNGIDYDTVPPESLHSLAAAPDTVSYIA
jgi:hypothetical protein